MTRCRSRVLGNKPLYFCFCLALVVLVVDSAAENPTPADSSPDPQAPAPAEVVDDATSQSDPLDVHGALALRYHLRFGDGDSDSDLSQHLRTTFGDEQNTGFSGAFQGRLTEDLDGRGDPEEFFLFRSLTDSGGSAVDGKLYTAYANYRPQGTPLEQIRVGRQYLYPGDVFQSDAVRFSLRPIEDFGKLRIDAFVGIPSHIYESSPDGDLIAGGSLLFDPWEGGSSAFHYVHLDDDTRYYGSVSNDLFTVSHGQRFGENLHAEAGYQHLNGDPYRVTARGEAIAPDIDLLVIGAFLASPTRQKELVYDLDSYYSAALDLAPYWTGDLAASLGLGERATWEVGVGWRSLFRSEDEGEFNREHVRMFTTLSLDHFMHETFDISMTGELWHEDDDDVGALTFEAMWRAREDLRLSAGTDYSLYRFDLLTETERHDSTGVFLNIRWLPKDLWRVDTRFRIEHDDFGTYGAIRTGLELGF